MKKSNSHMKRHAHRPFETLVSLVIVACTVAYGCSERREIPSEPVPPLERLTYEGDLKPVFDSQCVSCHGPTVQLGDYDMSTYEEILGNGSDDTPNAIAGDEQSLLVVLSLPGGSMNSFYQNATEVEMVRKWVVEDSLAQR
jgi:hypothetical protein